jgi:TonB-linked SusC/RagA family outer membrane protein
MEFSRRTWRRPAIALAVAALMSPLVSTRAAAQQGGAVRGTVTDSVTHAGIPGVQVTITGTNRNAITNDAGAYTIRGVPAGSVTVRAQRIGYAPGERRVTVSASDTTAVDFALHTVAAKLGEVVTIGYGTAARQNVSSAIASVTGQEIANAPVAGVDAALQGKMPGVQVLQNAGNPGNGISIRVRGPASLNAGNQPLFVVDGIPMLQENYSQLGLGGQGVTAVTGLNPDEIASIDVLKDAAATAIYGSRGSNGVVLITTKRGQAGDTKITFNSYYGQQDQPRRIGLVNAQQYVMLYNESAKNDGYSVAKYPFKVGVDDSATYDWQNAIFRSAPVSDVQLSVNGGTNRVQFYVSGSNFHQGGVVIGSQYLRQAGRANVDFNATDKLTIKTSVALTRERNNRIEGDGSNYGIVTNALGMQPMRPIRGSAFGYGGAAEGLRYANPVALSQFNSTLLSTQRTLGNIEARYAFTDRFSVTGRTGIDVLGLDELQWQSPKVDLAYAASANGVGKSGHTNANKYVNEGFLTFDALNTESQQLSVVAGASEEHNRSDLNYLRGEGFPSGFTTYIRNAATIAEYDGSATTNRLVSMFSRANYTLNSRYLLSASLRRDGSSRFGASQRWGLFPAASLGWIVSDEGFASGLSRFATLKLRASYGVTGNQGIGDFAALSLARGTPYGNAPGVVAYQLGNPDLRWETTRESDIGADLAFFGGRLGLIADYYHRKTTDLLVSRPIPALSGYTSIWSNVGAIQNNGVDLGIQTINIKPSSAGGFGWNSDLNLTFNHNKVVSLYGGQPIITGINGRQTSIAAVGQPLGEFYMYKFLSVDPADGNAIFAKAGGGTTKSPGTADKMYVGSPHPKYYGGFTNTMTLGRFDARGVLTFSQGNKIFNMMRIFTDDGGCTWDNLTSNVLARWQKAGDVTNVPRMSYDCTSGADLISSRFVEDGSYVRLDELTLGYKLPFRFGSARQSDARLYVSGRNLHLWTKYSGYNPDVNSAGSNANIVMGTDYYAYPLPRTVNVGINASW